MTAAISVSGLTRRYRGKLALDQVSVDIEAGSITGLVGRNGAGKTTLLRIIAGHEFPTAGSVTVASTVMFVREDQAYPDFKVRDALRAASWFYPNWSAEVAEDLMADFALPPSRGVKKLSRGMRSALGIVIGLASRAEITMLDEPYAGLDAVASQLFYDRLLTEYSQHPRTILLSTHQVDEAAGLLERVVLMDKGRVVLDAPADELRGAATRVSGPALAVQEFTAGHQVWDRRRMGSQESAVIVASPGARARQVARLTLEPVSLHELVRYAERRTTV